MRTIQSAGWYFPEHTGGTEVYVASLVSQLNALGIGSTVAAPLNAEFPLHSAWDGSPVYRYPVPAQQSFQQKTGEEPHARFDHFEQWLARQDAAIYHQHSWTYGCGLHHLRAARRQGLRTVLTIHVAGPVCLRGTMLRDGRSACNGAVTAKDCAACWLQAHGVPLAARMVLNRVPATLGRWARPMGRLGTAVAATELAGAHRTNLLAAAQCADHVVAVCEWLHDALRRHGVPPEKLSLNRQGIGNSNSNSNCTTLPKRNAQTGNRSLSVGFVGRWDPCKGPDVLVDAMLRLSPDCPIELQLMAIETSEPGMVAYMNEVRARAAGCTSIRFLPPVPPAQVAAFLASIDVLAVPSQWLETGPLVVLEAFAAGTPVLGSNLGGIRELVRDGHNGRLLPHDDPQAWANALCQLAASPETLLAWREGIAPVRTMREVALETQALYASLLGTPIEVGRK